MRRNLALALLTSPALAGCSLGNATPLPETSILIEKLPVVQNSSKSPCWQQRQIAAQRSYIATVQEKKEVIYRAPCDVDQKSGTSSQRVASN